MHDIYMLPSKVTSVSDMDTVKNGFFPKLATNTPTGILIRIDKNEASFWDEYSGLIPIINNEVLDEFISPIQYICERYDCIISGMLYPKYVDLYSAKKILLAMSRSIVVDKEFCQIYMLDTYIKSMKIEPFSERLERLYTYEEMLEDDHICVPRFTKLDNITELVNYCKKTFDTDNTKVIFVRTPESIYLDNSAFATDPTLTTASSFVQIKCNMLFSGKLINIESSIADTSKWSVYTHNKYKIVDKYLVQYKNAANDYILKIPTLQLGVIDNSTFITQKSLLLGLKDKLIGKDIQFTGFLGGVEDKGYPVGTSFSQFQQI